MTDLKYTSIQEIGNVVSSLNETFSSGKTRTLDYRINQLKQLGFLVQDNKDLITESLGKDLGRSQLESAFLEVNNILTEVNYALANIKQWAKPENVNTTLAWGSTKPKIFREPKGVALIIAPFNYPISLALYPLIGAIAAGCCAVVKPSEMCPNNATTLANLLPQYLDQDSYRIVNGAIPETTALLDQKWDHIFYTGNGPVGKIVATAAAKNLTPTTLELGGKSPVIVEPDCNVKVTANRIIWGKTVNSGQTCIAPDYVLCHKSVLDKLVEEMKSVLKRFYLNDKAKSQESFMLSSPDLSKIISLRHLDRLESYLRDTRGNIVVGGNADSDQCKLEPTIVTNIEKSDVLMQEELFGPILPILTYETLDGAINHINSGDHPLALYVFTSKSSTVDKVRSQTRSGSIVHNDVILQNAIVNLPFGGVGGSGYGAYHGKRSFDTFTYERSAATVPTWLESALAGRYPPFSSAKLVLPRVLQGAYISFSRPERIGSVIGPQPQSPKDLTNPYMDLVRLIWQKLFKGKPTYFIVPCIAVLMSIPNVRKFLSS